MNYYPFHLGDYASHTAHLEPMEDLVYRRLLDLYYLREGPLPADIQATAKLIRARSMSADVESVLQEFFELTEDGWRQSRCDEEIARMQDKQSKARASAAASVNARRAKAERSLSSESAAVERSLQDSSTDVELPTPTPTPTPTPVTPPVGGDRPRKRSANPASLSRPEDVAEQTWADWQQLRKAKKAPVTATVVNSARKEAEKADMPLDAFLQVWCLRGSQGLQADWLKPHERQTASRTSFADADEQARRKRWEEMTGRKWPSSAPSKMSFREVDDLNEKIRAAGWTKRTINLNELSPAQALELDRRRTEERRQMDTIEMEVDPDRPFLDPLALG